MSTVPEQFARLLRSERERAEMSQEALAFAAGLHPNAIGLLERGEREPLLGTVLALARGLGVPARTLVDGLTPEPVDQPD